MRESRRDAFRPRSQVRALGSAAAGNRRARFPTGDAPGRQSKALDAGEPSFAVFRLGSSWQHHGRDGTRSQNREEQTERPHDGIERARREPRPFAEHAADADRAMDGSEDNEEAVVQRPPNAPARTAENFGRREPVRCGVENDDEVADDQRDHQCRRHPLENVQAEGHDASLQAAEFERFAPPPTVIPTLVAEIHGSAPSTVALWRSPAPRGASELDEAWIPGTRPGMTLEGAAASGIASRTITAPP